ncbi:unnamed protein product [Closterium sp. NIES-54]
MNGIHSFMYSVASSAIGSVGTAEPSLGPLPIASVGNCVVTRTRVSTADALLSLSGASMSFFRNHTTVTSLFALVSVALADPKSGPPIACSSTTLPCRADPSGSLDGLRISSFSGNLLLDSRDVTFDESMSYLVRYPHRCLLVPPPPLFLTPTPSPCPAPPVRPPHPDPATSGLSHATPLPSIAPMDSGGADAGGASAGGAGSGARGAGVGGVESGGAEAGGTSIGGAGSGGAGARCVDSGGAGARDAAAATEAVGVATVAAAAVAVAAPTAVAAAAETAVTPATTLLLLLPLTFAATYLVATPPTSPQSAGGEYALGSDVLEDRQFELKFRVVASPHLCAVLLAPGGDPGAPHIPTPRTYTEAVSGQWAFQRITAMDAKMV